MAGSLERMNLLIEPPGLTVELHVRWPNRPPDTGGRRPKSASAPGGGWDVECGVACSAGAPPRLSE